MAAFADGVTGGSIDGEPYDARVDLDGHIQTGSLYATDTLAIGKGAPNFAPGKTGATVALELDGDFDAAAKELKGKGVRFLMDTYDNASCTMILIEDPDGNQVMIHKRK